jgi:hypothetical protein
LYAKREDGGRGLKSFKELYDETKVTVACYMATSNNEWIKVSWRNEYLKEQTSLKREAEEEMQRVNAQVELNFGDIKIGNESYVDWKAAWRKNIIEEGQRRNTRESFREKKLQSEIPVGFEKRRS